MERSLTAEKLKPLKLDPIVGKDHVKDKSRLSKSKIKNVHSIKKDESLYQINNQIEKRQ